jgi:hypothetical protein
MQKQPKALGRWLGFVIAGVFAGGLALSAACAGGGGDDDAGEDSNGGTSDEEQVTAATMEKLAGMRDKDWGRILDLVDPSQGCTEEQISAYYLPTLQGYGSDSSKVGLRGLSVTVQGVRATAAYFATYDGADVARASDSWSKATGQWYLDIPVGVCSAAVAPGNDATTIPRTQPPATSRVQTRTPTPTVAPSRVTVDPCSLVTAEEAAEVLGAEVSVPEGDIETPPTFSSCTYDTPLGDYGSLILQVVSDARQASNFRTDLRSDIDLNEGEEVPGSWDVGVWHRLGQAGGFLEVVKGSVVLEMSLGIVTTGSETENREAITNLMEVAVARLP